jgi:hypothetical protein
MMWLEMSHILVLGTCWSRKFWLIFHNHVGSDHATSQLRSSARRIPIVKLEICNGFWVEEEIKKFESE